MTTKKRIVLATANARYSHTSLALRYLQAAVSAIGLDAVRLEFTLQDRPQDMLERILEASPALVALSVTVWNVTVLTELAAMLKALRPEIVLVAGGPEVWHEQEDLAIARLADHVVTGEADLLFPRLAAELLDGGSVPHRLDARPPDLGRVSLPYAFYTPEDLQTRLTYVETSRGCPFRCTFCLSSLTPRVRYFPLAAVCDAVVDLIHRGARSLKFVDRSINVRPRRFQAILETCLRHHTDGLELHFEVVPTPLPQAVLDLLARFPPGAVQLEVGVQTFTPAVARGIVRPFQHDRVTRFLEEVLLRTAVHIHADLIFGLPGETLDSFASSFDALLGLGPHEIQVGILKRLRGTPMAAIGPEVLRFNPNPPYEVLETDTVSYQDMNRVKRFARYFDLYHNSGRFEASMRRLLTGDTVGRGDAPDALGTSAFHRFMRFADWLHGCTGRTHGLALVRLYEHLFHYLVDQLGQDPDPVGRCLLEDYDRHQIRRRRLEFLKPILGHVGPAPVRGEQGSHRRRGGPRRRT